MTATIRILLTAALGGLLLAAPAAAQTAPSTGLDVLPADGSKVNLSGDDGVGGVEFAPRRVLRTKVPTQRTPIHPEAATDGDPEDEVAPGQGPGTPTPTPSVAALALGANGVGGLLIIVTGAAPDSTAVVLLEADGAPGVVVAIPIAVGADGIGQLETFTLGDAVHDEAMGTLRATVVALDATGRPTLATTPIDTGNVHD